VAKLRIAKGKMQGEKVKSIFLSMLITAIFYRSFINFHFALNVFKNVTQMVRS